MDGRFLIGNNLKRGHDEPGFRKSVQKDCQNTYSKEFFPKRTPPVGLRQNLGGIVLICQQKSRNEFKEGKETNYTTLFDQGLEFQYIQPTDSNQKTQIIKRDVAQNGKKIKVYRKIINKHQLRGEGSIQLQARVSRLGLFSLRPTG